MARSSSDRLRAQLFGSFVFLGAAVLVLWFALNGDHPRGSHPDGQVSSSFDDRQPVLARDIQADVGVAAIGEAHSTGQSGNSGPELTPASEAQPFVISIKCVGPDDAAVPGVELRCKISNLPRGGPPPDAISKVRIRETVVAADLDGAAAIESWRRDWARIELVSDAWHLRPAYVRFGEDDSVMLRLSPIAAVRVFVQYADGLPCATRAALTRHDPPASWMFMLSEQGTATVRVAVDRPLMFRVFSKRVGYSHNYREDFSTDLLTGTRELHVIVPVENPALGSVVVHFPPGYLGNREELIFDQPWGASRKQIPHGASSMEFPGLYPANGYRVTIYGKNAWRSESFEVKKGEVVILQAEFSAGVTVRARLVDQRGHPVRDGALRLGSEHYLGYLGPDSPACLREHRSDAEGYVTLSGLPAGVLDLEAEAWGKEPSAHRVESAAGDELDLGTVTLRDGIGEIKVQLVGVTDGEEYSVYLGREDTALMIRPFVAVENTVATIKDLPVRPYTVAATFRKGGPIVSARVELAPDAPTQTVRLDVSGLTRDDGAAALRVSGNSSGK